MGFLSVPNTAKFDVLFNLGSVERAQFSIYVRNDGDPWDAAQLDAKIDDIRASVLADYIPVLSVDHDYVGIVARDLEPQFGRVEQQIEAAPVPGTLNSPSLPANVGVVCKLITATGAPRTGRWTLMPPTEGQVTGDDLTGAAQTALQDAAEALFNAADSGAGNAVVVVSRYSGSELVDGPHGQTLLKPKLRNNAAITNEVARVAVRTLVGSTRSRRRKAS